jgi:ADP-heptose:LPS heptosyltransferase
VGDVLLSAPAVALLRASLPRARITYLIGPWSKEVAEHGPPIDEVRAIAFPGFTRSNNANLVAPYALLVREAARLRKERFDLAIVLRPDHWWGALLVAMCGIPMRVGGDTPATRPLLTHRRAVPADEHWAEQALGLSRLALQVSGVPVQPVETALFHVSQAARQHAADLWRQHALEHRTVIALQPSAGAPLKRWPLSRWALVARKLQADGFAVILTGAPADADLLAELNLAAPQFVGQSLDETGAIFERCGLVIGLDGGAAHLAAAVGTPTIRLYGPASATTYGPWPVDGSHQIVLATTALACVPCGNLEAPPCGASTLPACLLAIDVDRVVELARRQLSRG